VGLFLILSIILIISFKLRHKIVNIKQLPEEVGLSFKSAAMDILHLSWTRTDNFYTKELIKNSREYSRVKNLFDDFLYGNTLTVLKITAVYNDNLVDAFVAGQTNWLIRLDDNQKLFQQNSWQDNMELREWVMDQFKSRITSFPWNEGAKFPILPACHGTDLKKALKICNSGFASLNTIDAGFYGKGIYVTSYAEYALRYAIGNNPCIIISWILPGHPYPVIEHHKGENTLMGGPMKPKCQSHYVRTDNRGYVFTAPRSTCFDEIVLAQENFIVPAFLLEMDINDIYQLQQRIGVDPIQPNESIQRSKKQDSRSERIKNSVQDSRSDRIKNSVQEKISAKIIVEDDQGYVMKDMVFGRNYKV